jgi:class 3 adenylate cyclase
VRRAAAGFGAVLSGVWFATGGGGSRGDAEDGHLAFLRRPGSTALGERLDPEALREVMSRYFTAAREAVQRHGGTVEKFVGDAVLAVFGIPELREDDALRAVRVAAELRDSLTDLSHELMGSMGSMGSMGIQLSVRTGVNTGSVIAGSASAGGSFATGDAVNTAARLEQGAASGEILIGASTLWLVRDAVEVEAIAPLAAKGKAEPLPAYRLLRVLDSELPWHL